MISPLNQWMPSFCNSPKCKESDHILYVCDGLALRMHRDSLHVRMERREDGTFSIQALCYTKNVHLLISIPEILQSRPLKRTVEGVKKIEIPRPLRMLDLLREARYALGNESTHLSAATSAAIDQRIVRDGRVEATVKAIVPLLPVLIPLIMSYHANVLEDVFYQLWEGRFKSIVEGGPTPLPKKGEEIIEDLMQTTGSAACIDQKDKKEK